MTEPITAHRIRQIAHQIAGLEGRVEAVERGSQLEHSSVVDSAGNDLDVVQGLRAGFDGLDAAKTALDAAGEAQRTASGKGTAYYNPSTDPPPEGTDHDVWFVADKGYQPRRWDGTQWVPAALGTEAIATNAIITGLIDAGAVTADKLAAKIVLASAFIAGDPGGARVQLDPTGLHAYDTAGTESVRIGADGGAKFSGDVVGSVIEGSLLRTGEDGQVRVEVGGQDPELADNIRFYADDGANPSALVEPYSLQGILTGARFHSDPTRSYGSSLTIGTSYADLQYSDGSGQSIARAKFESGELELDVTGGGKSSHLDMKSPDGIDMYVQSGLTKTGLSITIDGVVLPVGATTELIYQNGWQPRSGYPVPIAQVMPGGHYVQLHGQISPGDGSNGVVAMILPSVKWQPAEPQLFPVTGPDVTGKVPTLQVRPDGKITLFYCGAHIVQFAVIYALG